jgi:hypothetical protein
MKYLKNFANKYAAPILGLIIAGGIYSCVNINNSQEESPQKDYAVQTNRLEQSVDSAMPKNTMKAETNFYSPTQENQNSVYQETRDRVFNSLTSSSPSKLSGMTESDEKIWADLTEKCNKGAKK